MKDNSAVIVNLTEQSWTLHRSYGTFTVRGAENDVSNGDAATNGASCNDEAARNTAARHGHAAAHTAVQVGHAQLGARPLRGSDVPYTLTRVTGRNALMDLGDKRSIDVPISAVEVAQDLCHEINSDGGEDSYFGVFVTEHDEPTEDELAGARLRLETFYRRLVAAADREWERSHSYLFINDVERRAAQYLGLEKEWFYQAREMADCPACGEKVKLGVAVCKTCGAILDREKAAAHGLGLAPVAAAPVAVPSTSAERPAQPAQPAQPATARR